MHVSARAVLTAGIAALTGGALAFTPSLLPGSMRTIEVLRPVTFTADSGMMAPVTDDDVRAALDLIGELGSLPGRGKITVRLGDEAATAFPANPARGISNQAPDTPPQPGPGAPVPAAGQSAEITAVEPLAIEDPTALNAASDVIDSVYSVTRYWANYVSLELGPWVLDWVPLGYLVSDQIYIWYPDFVLPVTDSFVYDFLDPVANDPLNLQVWQQGVSDIVNTAVNGLYNGVNNEIQYILDFGWFPIPLPPLPPLPFASSTTETAFALTAAEAQDSDAEAGEVTESTGVGEEAGAEETSDETTTPGAPEAADETTDDTEETPVKDPGEVTEELVDESEPAVEDSEAPAEDTVDESEDPADVDDEALDDEALDDEALDDEALDDVVDESSDESEDSSDSDSDAGSDAGGSDAGQAGDSSDVRKVRGPGGYGSGADDAGSGADDGGADESDSGD